MCHKVKVVIVSKNETLAFWSALFTREVHQMVKREKPVEIGWYAQGLTNQMHWAIE